MADKTVTQERDEIALVAMRALATKSYSAPSALARDSYDIADAMLAESGRRERKDRGLPE